jgi:hypothetical protein
MIRCSQNAVQILQGSPEPVALCQETVGCQKNNRSVVPELMTLCQREYRVWQNNIIVMKELVAYSKPLQGVRETTTLITHAL